MNGAKKIIVYRDPAGREPFTDWLHGLRDAAPRRRILKRLLRLEQGYYGDSRRWATVSVNYASFLGPATGSTSPKMATP